MRDGQPPSRAVKVAAEMQRQEAEDQAAAPAPDDGQEPSEPTPGMEHGGVSDRLSYAERKRMPKSEFAMPGKRDGGKGGYPIPDAAHARNALARVAQFGSPEEQRRVRAKVHAAFPDIK